MVLARAAYPCSGVAQERFTGSRAGHTHRSGQVFVTAVAEGRGLSVLATAPGHAFIFFYVHDHRPEEPGLLVAAVAIWLVGGLAAAAPGATAAGKLVSSEPSLSSTTVCSVSVTSPVFIIV